MKPCKLKNHLDSKHPQHVGKDRSFFQRNEATLKRQKLDFEGYFQQQNKALVEASYETAFAIAKQTKPKSIGETLVKPCAITMVKLVLGENCVKKIEQISLSDNTVKRRIVHSMSLDVKQQVINEIKSSPFFALQVEESTDVALGAQSLVSVCNIHEYVIKNEFLFCTPLKTTTRSADVFETISTFFDMEGLEWNKVCGICTDGAKAMLGTKLGFQAKAVVLKLGSVVLLGSARQFSGDREALSKKTKTTLLKKKILCKIKFSGNFSSNQLNKHNLS